MLNALTYIGSKLEYPKVNVGILTPMNNGDSFEEPSSFNNPQE